MTFDEKYFAIGQLDRLAYGRTWVHRLDPRAKVATTVLFLITVVSLPKYEVAALVPFFLFPVFMMTMGGIPARFIVGKVLIVSPFALLVGIFNPFLDTRTAVVIGGIPLSGGILSFCSLLLKFALTVSATLLLIATTSFPGVCHAFRRFGVPPLFVSQLLFLYRYLFVLMEEAMRIVRARDVRSFGGRGTGMKIFFRLAGTLFLRTVDRAQRVYDAMLSRGFQGDIPMLRRSRLAPADAAFMAVAVACFGVLRFAPVTEGIGRVAQGVLG